jgi:hypothetical protein
MPAPADPLSRALRLAEGRAEQADDIAWMRDCLARWLRHGGRLPFERLAGLPTAGRLQIVRRNIALIEAAQLLAPEVAGPRDLAERLASELRRHARTWRGVAALPAGADPLHMALHEALTASDGAVLGARQLQRILDGHDLAGTCPPPAPTVTLP